MANLIRLPLGWYYDQACIHARDDDVDRLHFDAYGDNGDAPVSLLPHSWFVLALVKSGFFSRLTCCSILLEPLVEPTSGSMVYVTYRLSTPRFLPIRTLCQPILGRPSADILPQ
jgi:hypothetical protein